MREGEGLDVNIPVTDTHAMSNVDPWKEGLRRSKRVAAVYGGLGLESFQ